MRWMLLFRLISNTGVRFVYSFLPALTRGTGLSEGTLGTVLALRDLSGVAAPGIGHVVQRHGTVRVMGLGATLATLCYFVATLGAPGLAIGLVLSGVGKIVFDVGMNTWVGDEVAYERRARASGLVEGAWAAAALVGLPLCGLAIDRIGWQAAPALLGIAGIAPVLAINRLHSTGQVHEAQPNVRLRFSASSIAVIVGFCAMTLTSQFLIVGHGKWLDETYGLDATQIGFAVISVGVIEAVASGATAQYTDRLGKRNAVMGGMVLLAVACGAFALAPSPPLAIGLVILAAAFLGFEFAFVSALPLIAELDPVSRAKMLGLALGLSTVMRAAGSPVGLFVQNGRGFATLMALGAAGAVLTFVVFAVVVVEPDDVAT